MTRDARTLRERFEAKVDRSGGPDACHLWTASTSRGYGIIGVAGTRTRRSHRVAWELESGPIPDGMCVCHRCDNRACCNVTHLFLGTLSDNIADMVSKGRNAKGPTAARGAAHGLAKLDEASVRLIRGRLAAGEDAAAIARANGVSRSLVREIKHGRVWGHLKEVM